MKVDCTKCEHYCHGVCFYEFERAANANGAAVDNCDDVYFCRDFSDVLENL